MIFPKPLLAPILAGSVTTALRPHVDGQDDFKLRRYPISRRGGPRVCSIQVTHADLVDLETLTDEHAQQDGYPTIGDYLHAWTNLHNTAWTGAHAWRIRFHVAPAKETVRLLTKQSGRKDAGQYTTQRRFALDEEPEAVDPDTVERIAAASSAEWAKRQAERAARYRDLPLEVRLAQAKRDAQERHVDISPELRVIERRLAAIETKTGRAAA